MKRKKELSAMKDRMTDRQLQRQVDFDLCFKEFIDLETYDLVLVTWHNRDILRIKLRYKYWLQGFVCR
jgi:hypothetical protein